MSRFFMDRDQEDRAALALGALEALDDLLVNQNALATIPAEPFAHLMRVIGDAVRAAIPNGEPRHPRAVNDLEASP